ncbi:MAG: F0F1 ATP synthase subunit beta, partial [Lachnospiraceae bacterium]|nr:F0F1 ATP synthase subunit beta [Lachnospiraceae bacterium]
MNTGKIIQVSGPVVDVMFETGSLPHIKDALRVQVDGQERVMEVAKHMG